MKEIYSDERKHILTDDLKLYTFTRKEIRDKDNYRPSYLSSSTSEWFLTYYEEKDQLGHIIFTIDALIDEYGNYMKIGLGQPKVRRILILNGRYIQSDTLYDRRRKSAGQVYSGIETIQLMPLVTHLEKGQQFENLPSYAKTGPIFENEKIYKFLKTNECLKPLIEKRSKAKK